MKWAPRDISVPKLDIRAGDTAQDSRALDSMQVAIHFTTRGNFMTILAEKKRPKHMISDHVDIAAIRNTHCSNLNTPARCYLPQPTRKAMMLAMMPALMASIGKRPGGVASSANFRPLTIRP